MKVIVTGSRDFSGRALVWFVLNDLHRQVGALIVVHGACPTGADKYADEWARIAVGTGMNVLVDRYPANWDHGRGAGMARNAEMVKAGADLVVAFFAPPPATNKGTAGCAKLARRAGIEVREYGRESQSLDDDAEETLPL